MIIKFELFGSTFIREVKGKNFKESLISDIEDNLKIIFIEENIKYTEEPKARLELSLKEVSFLYEIIEQVLTQHTSCADKNCNVDQLAKSISNKIELLREDKAILNYLVDKFMSFTSRATSRIFSTKN